MRNMTLPEVADITQKIVQMLDAIRKLGIDIVHTKNGDNEIYSFGDRRYKVEIKIEEKWLGLDFDLLGTKVYYPINTAVYDITSDEHKEFAVEIGNDILSFLSNLKEGRFMIATNAPRAMLIALVGDQFIVLRQGFIFASAQKINSIQALEKKYNFRPFPLIEK
jgi:hypothetical protein